MLNIILVLLLLLLLFLLLLLLLLDTLLNNQGGVFNIFKTLDVKTLTLDVLDIGEIFTLRVSIQYSGSTMVIFSSSSKSEGSGSII